VKLPNLASSQNPDVTTGPAEAETKQETATNGKCLDPEGLANNFSKRCTPSIGLVSGNPKNQSTGRESTLKQSECRCPARTRAHVCTAQPTVLLHLTCAGFHAHLKLARAVLVLKYKRGQHSAARGRRSQ
jgi:hypothetical protein